MNPIFLELRNEKETLLLRIGTKLRDEDVDVIFIGYADAGLFHMPDHPFYASGKTDAGRWLTSEEFQKSVVSSPSANGILRSQRAVPELENRLCVVVETANEQGVQIGRASCRERV